jgi:hypothetical protein
MAQLRYSQNVKISGSITHSFVLPEYVIPAGTIVFYNGANPSITDWSRYTAADGLLIIGADVQSNVAVANTTGNFAAPLGPFSIGGGGDHNAGSGLTAYVGANYSIITTPPGFFSGAGPSGAHAHSAPSASFGTLPAGVNTDTSNVTLIRLNVASNVFPSSVIHICNTATRPDWSQFLAPAPANGTTVRYLRGGNGVAHNDGNTHTFSGSLSPGGAHGHGFSEGPTRSVGSAIPNFNNYIDYTGSHNHGLTGSVGIGSLKSKALKMWTSAYEHKISNTTSSSSIIAMYNGNLNDLPSYWVLCDGSNDTIDMRECFLGCATTSGISHGSSNTANLSYPSLSVATDPWVHTHLTPSNPIPFAFPTGHGSTGIPHSHPVTDSGSVSGLKPPHIYLAFIQFKPF